MIRTSHAFPQMVLEGNNFVKCIVVCEPLVRKKLKTQYNCPPDPLHVDINAAMGEFYVPEQSSNPSRTETSKRKSKTKQHFKYKFVNIIGCCFPNICSICACCRKLLEELLCEFKLMINFLMFRIVVHKCGFGCGCADAEHTTRRIVTLVIRLLFWRRPKRPELKEWTAVGTTAFVFKSNVDCELCLFDCVRCFNPPN